MAEFQALYRASPRLLSRCQKFRSINTQRTFATALGDGSTVTQTSARTATHFKDKLNTGPSFADFVGGRDEPLTPEDALELRTAMVGPAGKQKQITRLPEWLKTPVPVGDNFKKIKKDLRGLNLHTGASRVPRSVNHILPLTNLDR